MTILFLILIVICSVILGFVILVQNPKGGGLNGSVGGFSNQFMGVKQTTDVLEKGTWMFAALIAILCLSSSLFMGSGTTTTKSILDEVPTSGVSAPATPKAQATPVAPATGDTPTTK